MRQFFRSAARRWRAMEIMSRGGEEGGKRGNEGRAGDGEGGGVLHEQRVGAAPALPNGRDTRTLALSPSLLCSLSPMWCEWYALLCVLCVYVGVIAHSTKRILVTLVQQ